MLFDETKLSHVQEYYVMLSFVDCHPNLSYLEFWNEIYLEINPVFISFYSMSCHQFYVSFLSVTVLKGLEAIIRVVLRGHHDFEAGKFKK